MIEPAVDDVVYSSHTDNPQGRVTAIVGPMAPKTSQPPQWRVHINTAPGPFTVQWSKRRDCWLMP